MLLRDLDRQARQHGGAVYMLNGNHESMNVSGNYRYICLRYTLKSSWPKCCEQGDASMTRLDVAQGYLKVMIRL